MSVTVYVKDWDKKLEAEIAEKFSPEQVEKMNLWKGEGMSEEAQASWELYNENIKPLEDKFMVNMSNSNFKEVFALLDINVMECSSLNGEGLEAFKIRITDMLNVIKTRPDEFNTLSTVTSGEGGCTIIQPGRRHEYFLCRLAWLYEIASSADEIYWGQLSVRNQADKGSESNTSLTLTRSDLMYTVYDEMACAVLLETENEKEARENEGVF